MRENILIVEDEKDIQELLLTTLHREGYRAEAYSSGEEALDAAGKQSFELALLDIMLPGIDGMEICRRLRSDPVTESIPVIFLSAKSEEADIVSGLEMGAVNYITKPFKIKTVISMIRGALRLTLGRNVGADGAIHLNGCVLHPGKHELRIDGQRVDLTLTEFRILKLLMKKPGWVFSRYQIIDLVHSPDHSITDRAVDIQIVNLRRKLGQASILIETVRGIGYRFVEVD